MESSWMSPNMPSKKVAFLKKIFVNLCTLRWHFKRCWPVKTGLWQNSRSVKVWRASFLKSTEKSTEQTYVIKTLLLLPLLLPKLFRFIRSLCTTVRNMGTISEARHRYCSSPSYPFHLHPHFCSLWDVVMSDSLSTELASETANFCVNIYPLPSCPRSCGSRFFPLSRTKTLNRKREFQSEIRAGVPGCKASVDRFAWWLGHISSGTY